MIRNDFVESTDVEIDGIISDFIIDVNDIESESKIWESSINTYSNKHRFVTEIVSNAYDATVEKAELLGESVEEFVKEHPIIVRFDSDSIGEYIEIEESNGLGISPDRINNIYLKLGKTTKNKSITQIGSKGIGKFSCLAYTDKCFITSRYNGIESQYTMYKYTELEDKLGNVKQYTKPRLICNYTDIPTEKTGTKVKCYINNYYTISNDVKYQLRWFNSVYIDDKIGTDLKGFNSIKLHKFNHFVIADGYDGEMIALLEKVPYRINWSELGISKISTPIALKFSTSDLSVNQSREELLYNKIQYIYDENNNLVTDIESAIVNSKLKEGYTQVVRDVKDIVLEKIELAREEIRQYYIAEKKSHSKIIDYWNALSDNNFRGVYVSEFINEYPSIVGLEILSKKSNKFTHSYDFTPILSTNIIDGYRVSSNSVKKYAKTEYDFNNGKYVRVNVLDRITKQYLTSNYVGYVVFTDETKFKNIAPYYKMTSVFNVSNSRLTDFIHNDYNLTDLKSLLKTTSKEHLKAIKEFYKRLHTELADVETIVVPDDFKLGKTTRTSSVDKGECVYYDFSVGHRITIDKNTIKISKLNTISNLPILYTTKGSITYLDDFKKLDGNKVKVIFVAESYHKHINGIKYEDFMNNPEKYDLGRELATYWYVSTHYEALHRLKKALVALDGVESYLAIVDDLIQLKESSEFNLTDSLISHIAEKVKQNDVSLYGSIENKVKQLSTILEKNPILDLLFNTDSISNKYYTSSLNESVIPFIKKHIKL